MDLKRKVVLVLALRILAQPEQYGRKHDGSVLNHICYTIVLIPLRQDLYQIFHRQHCDTSGQAACHECESDEQEQPSSPLYGVTRESTSSTTKRECGTDISKMLLIDQVDNDHSEGTAETGDPVGKGDIGGWWFIGYSGVFGNATSHRRDDGGVEEEPPSESEEGSREIDAQLTLAGLKKSWEIGQGDETDPGWVVGSSWK